MANRLHVRSNSFPSASHPCTVRVEEELRNIKTWEATSTSTSHSVCNGLSFLEDLYICLDDLLNMASTQKLISQHQGEKCVEDILDGSVKMLDICGITRDTVFQIKENVQALHSSLRRRKGVSSIQTSVAEYNFFSKKMKKNVRKLITSLKQMESKFGESQLFNQDNQLVALVKVLREVIVTNIAVFQSLLSFLAVPASKSKKWSLVAKLMHKGVVSREDNSSNELQCVEASLSTLLREDTNVEKRHATHENLEALENAIESIENGLESLFRRMVKARACLLNTMTQ